MFFKAQHVRLRQEKPATVESYHQNTFLFLVFKSAWEVTQNLEMAIVNGACQKLSPVSVLMLLGKRLGRFLKETNVQKRPEKVAKLVWELQPICKFPISRIV